MNYVAIDLETTGLDLDRCQILEFAAVFENSASPVTDLPVYHRYVDNGWIQGEPYALNMNAGAIQTLSLKTDARIIEIQSLASDFFAWIIAQEMETAPPVDKLGRFQLTVAGKNYAMFDHHFIRRIPKWDTYFRVAHRTIDPAILFVTKEDKAIPSLQECLNRANIKREVKHTACADAYDVIDLMRYKGL